MNYSVKTKETVRIIKIANMTITAGASNTPPAMPPGVLGPNVPTLAYEGDHSVVQRNVPAHDGMSDEELHAFLAEVCSNDDSIWPMFFNNARELGQLRQRHYFQSISSIMISTPTATFPGIALSDDGACLKFGREGFF